MPDFSHLKKLRWSAESVAEVLRKGRPIADRMVVEAVDQLNPPLLSSSKLATLRWLIDDGAVRRGRPRGGQASRLSIVAELEQLRRDDVPAIFLDWLIARLRSGRRATEHDRRRYYDRRLMKHRRNLLLFAFYERIFAALDGSDVVDVPNIGRMTVPPDYRTKSEKALAMTRSALGYSASDLPSDASIVNIISKIRREKCE